MARKADRFFTGKAKVVGPVMILILGQFLVGTSVLLHLVCQSLVPQLTGQFPTGCPLLRKPRRSTKFRPMGLFAGRKCEMSSPARHPSQGMPGGSHPASG
jgi:hypothetical protein